MHARAWIGLCLGFFGSIGCSAPGAMFTPRLGQLDPSGDIGIQQGSSVSATSDVEALGLEKDSSVIGGRVDVEFGAHLTVSASQSSHDGDGTAQATISSGGVTITAGTPVSSELDLGVYDAMLTWDLVPTDAFELGLGVGVAAFDVDATFTDQTSGESVSTDQVLPLPLVVGRVGFSIWRIDVSGLVGWMEFDYDGDDVSMLDADVMAALRLLGDDGGLAGHLAIGYRFISAEVDYEDGSDAVQADLDFEGPYIGLALSI